MAWLGLCLPAWQLLQLLSQAGLLAAVEAVLESGSRCCLEVTGVRRPKHGVGCKMVEVALPYGWEVSNMLVGLLLSVLACFVSKVPCVLCSHDISLFLPSVCHTIYLGCLLSDGNKNQGALLPVMLMTKSPANRDSIF